MPKPTEIKPRDGYKIWLRYEDGVEGEVDLSDVAGKGVFAAWDDRAFFESARLDEYGDIAWNDEIGLCQDALYMEITGKTVDEVLPVIHPMTSMLFDGDMARGLDASIRSDGHHA